ncbi:hypothetical protein N7G274_000444 [Stereocaulon virgatum]|uniref:DUF1754-domain-containing protein n=1 Tax=Stereocaulon virgatum TaxID=373712 RepID=A0ABR4AS48_9LECA
MPGDEYSAAVSGGLKLKGVGSGSRVSKGRKKKVKPVQHVEGGKDRLERVDGGEDGGLNQDLKPEDEEADAVRGRNLGGDGSRERSGQEGERDGEDATLLPPLQRAGKTEAELRHEERRRRRLDERLKREGTKTHKERVEELNRYLSNLSEHHDMPRIGPG